MNYSQVGIANVALQRIGARGTIASFDEDSPNAIKVSTCWDTVYQEVLSERDWKFAKTRAQLQQSSVAPQGGYLYAYTLPSDFLRLCRPREIPQERRIADASVFWGGWGGMGGFQNHRWDIPVWPKSVEPYITETILQSSADPPVYATNLLTNYPYQSTYANVPPIIINYIRLVSDMSQLLPGFVNCLANRLAAELAVAVTEDGKKYEAMMQMYRDSMNGSQAQQECDDFLKDESGSQTWLEAGRYWRLRG